jgi:hypothetical protein
VADFPAAAAVVVAVVAGDTRSGLCRYRQTPFSNND